MGNSRTNRRRRLTMRRRLRRRQEQSEELHRQRHNRSYGDRPRQREREHPPYQECDDSSSDEERHWSDEQLEHNHQQSAIHPYQEVLIRRIEQQRERLRDARSRIRDEMQSLRGDGGSDSDVHLHNHNERLVERAEQQTDGPDRDNVTVITNDVRGGATAERRTAGFMDCPVCQGYLNALQHHLLSSHVNYNPRDDYLHRVFNRVHH